ncbi:MAG: DNA gyrase subunit A [Candidatus Aenigmatarchaeota archaeon]
MLEKNINDIKTSDYILEISREYSIYVCEHRAIPHLADGLKSSQRKMLWIMRNKKDKIKTISLAGEAISEGLYLHGDQSASQTISHLAAPFCNNFPLLTGIGSFGSLIDPYSFGAPRYTYVKKNTFTDKVLYADLDIVPLVENYDGSNLEPRHFLPLLPIVLLNGVSGIAVGWSSEILPRSLESLIDSVAKVLTEGKAEEIPPKYEYLDLNYKRIGENIWEFQGKIEKKDSSTVIVKSLPPELTLSDFKERLNSLEEEGKIQNYVDNSTENINITIKFRKGHIQNWNEEKIIEFLKLRTRKTERIVVVDFNGNSIKQYDNVKTLVEDWVNWRLGFYVKRYEKKLKECEEELEYWMALRKCFEKRILQFILKCKNKKEVLEVFRKIVGNISEENLERITNLPTYKWNEEFHEEIKSKITQLKDKVQEYSDLLSDNNNEKSLDKLKKIFLKEIMELKNLFCSRKNKS